jgi:hypothetical protein
MLALLFERCFRAFNASNWPLAQRNNAQAAIKYIVTIWLNDLLLSRHITTFFHYIKLLTCDKL